MSGLRYQEANTGYNPKTIVLELGLKKDVDWLLNSEQIPFELLKTDVDSPTIEMCPYPTLLEFMDPLVRKIGTGLDIYNNCGIKIIDSNKENIIDGLDISIINDSEAYTKAIQEQDTTQILKLLGKAVENVLTNTFQYGYNPKAGDDDEIPETSVDIVDPYLEQIRKPSKLNERR